MVSGIRFIELDKEYDDYSEKVYAAHRIDKTDLTSEENTKLDDLREEAQKELNKFVVQNKLLENIVWKLQYGYEGEIKLVAKFCLPDELKNQFICCYMILDDMSMHFADDECEVNTNIAYFSLGKLQELITKYNIKIDQTSVQNILKDQTETLNKIKALLQ